jgi:hypothetical protein
MREEKEIANYIKSEIKKEIDYEIGAKRVLTGLKTDLEEIILILNKLSRDIKRNDTKSAIEGLKSIKTPLPSLIAIDLERLLEGLEESNDTESALEYISIIRSQYEAAKKRMEER